MAELAVQGDAIGILYPVRIPQLGVPANIREALELFYYGNNDAGPALALGQEADIPSDSIAGRLRNISNAKLNIANPTTTGKLTTAASASGGAGLRLPHGAAPTSPVDGDVWTTTAGVFARINSTTSTLVPTTVTALSSLISLDDRTDGHTLQLAYGATSSGNTKTLNLGTGGVSGSTTVINLGSTNGTTLNLRGPTSITGSLSATGAISTSSGNISTSSGNISASGSLQGSSFIVGSSGPTITTGSAVPSASPPTGSLYLRTGQGSETSLYVRSTENWTAIRGAKWFSGTTDSPSFADQQPGDWYLNRVTGKVYKFT